MTDVVDGAPASADPPPPASLTAISIKVRRRTGEKPAVVLPPRKSGDLTGHLNRQAASAAAAPAPSQPSVVPEPEAVLLTPEPPIAAREFEPPPGVAHEVEPLVREHEPEAPATEHEPEAPVVTYEFELPVVAHEPEPPVVAHEFEPPVVAHEFEPPVVAHEFEPTSIPVDIVSSLEARSVDALPEELALGEPDPAPAVSADPEPAVPPVADEILREYDEIAPESEVAPEPEIAPEPEAPYPPVPPALSIVPTQRSEPRVVAPAPTPAAPPPAVTASGHAPHAPEFSDIAAYWRSICGDRDYPTVSGVDRDLVSKRWPGTLMISFTRTHGVRDPSIGGVARLGTASTAMQEAIDSGSYAIEWMIEVGRAALAASAPLEELQRLPTRAGTIAFRLLALPLGVPHAEPDTVLCHLAPAAAAPRFGKRRNWLAA